MDTDDRNTPEPVDDDSSGDYSYDMAHEVPAEPRHPSESARGASHPTGDVPPPDPDGDYSYDLAHEVPRAKE